MKVLLILIAMALMIVLALFLSPYFLIGIWGIIVVVASWGEFEILASKRSGRADEKSEWGL